MGAADIYVEYAIKPDEPRLSAPVQKGAVRVGRMVRDYKAFVPAHLPPGSPLLLVFHGSAQESEEIRMWTGYEFDRLADLHKFAVVYPVGYGGNWNDCRKNVVYPARAQNIDDKGLVAALIDHFHETAGIDPRHVFAMGFSNGGHFVYRLALEMPDRISGVAAVAANLPTEDNNICHVAGKPVPVLIVNGTGDPINPFVGGEVALFGLGSRGTVRSSEQIRRVLRQAEPVGTYLPGGRASAPRGAGPDSRPARILGRGQPEGGSLPGEERRARHSATLLPGSPDDGVHLARASTHRRKSGNSSRRKSHQPHCLRARSSIQFCTR